MKSQMTYHPVNLKHENALRSIRSMKPETDHVTVRAGAMPRLRVHATTCVRAKSDSAPSDDACEARPLDDGTFLAVVADGIGGARLGCAAAAKACSVYLANFRNRPRAWTVAKTLEEITHHLNRQLHQEGLARFEKPELATTVAVAALAGDQLRVLNLGDSRIYRLRDRELHRLTTDHRDPQQSHVLTQALGLSGIITPHAAEFELLAGDVLLLCSDGLSDVLDDETLKTLLAQRAGARSCVAAAREKATPETLDDITAVVLEVLETGSADADAPGGLPIPEKLNAGDIVDGFTLRHRFRVSDRIWLAARAGKTYVLKFAPADARSNETTLTNFVREIWHATSLQAEFFPNAFVPAGATARYYAMEYLRAPTLRQWLDKRGGLETNDAVALAKFLLTAEQFLLGHDFVHGDVKPENILVLGERGTLTFKLIDLGNVTEIFGVSSRAGTPSYLAPERFAGRAISEGTEIFSLGATLFEAVTKTLPYGEIEPFQTPAFRKSKKPTALNPHLPAWFEAVLLRAIAVKPEERYANYSEMMFELENPAKVRPFRPAGLPLIESNPQLLLKIALVVSVLVNLVLFVRMLLPK
jgi:serine/threonine protein phosphatase PrpC